jgi:ketol-acid reductoisomerase
MTALDPDALLGTLVLEGARIAVLGYDPDARDHAIALRRAGNHVVISVQRDTVAWSRALADGFAVDEPSAAVATAEIVVVRAAEDSVSWRQCEERIAGGALVVFACARALHTGRCARGGMDVVLVTGVEDPRVGCRLAVHRDVSRRALLRAVAYARAAYASDVPMRSTSICAEAELEHASVRDRSASLLALTVQSPAIAPKAPTNAWNADDEPEPADIDDAGWFHAMMNRRGTP